MSSNDNELKPQFYSLHLVNLATKLEKSIDFDTNPSEVILMKTNWNEITHPCLKFDCDLGKLWMNQVWKSNYIYVIDPS